MKHDALWAVIVPTTDGHFAVNGFVVGGGAGGLRAIKPPNISCIFTRIA
jgi:hypothetical protein